MKRPSHDLPSYVVARVRKLLRDRGLPVHVLRTEVDARGHRWRVAEEGYEVSTVGVSNYVAVCYEGARLRETTRPVSRETKVAKEAEVRALLTGLGYTLDERGWIVCERNHLG